MNLQTTYKLARKYNTYEGFLAAVKFKVIPPTDAKDLIKQVAEVTGIPYNAIVGKVRNRDIVDARHLAILVIYEAHPKQTLKWVGDWFKKDHASVSHAVKKLRDIMQYDKKLAEYYKLLKQ